MTRGRLFSNRRVMSLSAAEFAASIANLGAARRDARGGAVFDLAPAGSVTVTFEPSAPKIFGGLLALPQAVVTLEFDGASDEARENFVGRFDIAFQRGGG